MDKYFPGQQVECIRLVDESYFGQACPLTLGNTYTVREVCPNTEFSTVTGTGLRLEELVRLPFTKWEDFPWFHKLFKPVYPPTLPPILCMW